MKLIVGLGNPGKAYEGTPHNVGFEVLDLLAARLGVGWRRRFRFRAHTARAVIGGQPVLLAKPGAYMNQSGPVVAAVARSVGAVGSEVVVVLDDADLPVGRMRVRGSGRAGGHRGLDSILGQLGTEDCVRVRLGIGRPDPGTDLMTYVLRPFPESRRAPVRVLIGRAADAVECIVTRGLEAAMTEFNAPGPGGMREEI